MVMGGAEGGGGGREREREREREMPQANNLPMPYVQGSLKAGVCGDGRGKREGEG